MTINEQSIFDQVKQCLPWRSDECILNGLKKCQYNFDETVEYLINDPSSDALEEEKKDIDEKNKIEENIPPERHSKVKIKKSKDKQNEPVISKKVISSNSQDI